VTAITTYSDVEAVRGILETAGLRGASHEDFVEAGLARDYIGSLRRLVDQHGLEIRTDFTTGQPRWTLVAEATRTARAA
jgi:hypothetical protein